MDLNAVYFKKLLFSLNLSMKINSQPFDTCFLAGLNADKENVRCSTTNFCIIMKLKKSYSCLESNVKTYRMLWPVKMRGIHIL